MSLELAHLHESGARFIVRLNWSTVPLREPGGAPFDLLSALRALPEAEAGSFDLQIQPDPKHDIPALPVRLVAVRKTEDAAEEARRKVLKEASRRGKKVQPKTLELAGYVLLVTSISDGDLSAEDVLELYRFRWQIELVFKRLKSLLQLDDLSAKEPQLTRTYLYAKLLGAILLEDLSDGYVSFSPWGYRIRPRAAALRIQRVLLASMCFALLDGVRLSAWFTKADRLQRHLHDTPRRRIKQATRARQRAHQLPRLS